MVSDRGGGPYLGSDGPDQAHQAITSVRSLDINLTICSTVGGRSVGRRRTVSVSNKVLLRLAPAMSNRTSHTE